MRIWSCSPGLRPSSFQMKPDVIVAFNTPAARAAIDATKKIPIALLAGDPVGTGFVSNLAHPGGTVTGVTGLPNDLAAKRLQLLKEMIPIARRIAILFNPDDPLTGPARGETQGAAARVGVEVSFFPVQSQDRLIATFHELQDWKP